jgi:hypothetical protein
MTDDKPRLRDARVVHLGLFTGPSQRVLGRCRRLEEGQLVVITGGVYVATVDTDDCGLRGVDRPP